jgi:carbonic anhydrase
MVELQFSMEAFVYYRAWLRRIHDEDPEFFTRLVKQQTPRIGCSDGRVPANEIVGLDPGEVRVQESEVVQTAQAWAMKNVARSRGYGRY